MTSSGSPVGGERSYYVEGESQGRVRRRTEVAVIPNWIGSKIDDENSGDTLRGDGALTEGNKEVGECRGGAEWG